VQDVACLPPQQLALPRRPGARRDIHRRFLGGSAPAARAGADGDPVRDGRQPAPQRIVPADAAGLVEQDEERGLEGVVEVVAVAQDLPAHGEDPRAVPAQQLLERALVLAGQVAVEDLSVGQAAEPGGRRLVEAGQQAPQ
jgi:hypothetical protein